MKTSIMLLLLASMGCGDAATKSKTNPNNANNTNNVNNTNNANNTNNYGIVDMSQFDQTCQYDSNCVLVEPDVCNCGRCSGVGVNIDDLDAFESARASIMCSTNDPLVCPAIECEETVATCWEGTCQARTPFLVDAEIYETQCEVNSDCIAIFTGDPCSSCQCGTAAVNLASYEANPPRAQRCTPEPPTCECAPQTTASCDNGTCVLGFN